MPVGLQRLQQEGHLHFLTLSCHHRLAHLNTPTAYTTIETWLETLRHRHNFEVDGYVLMPEHVHLLLSEPKHHALRALNLAPQFELVHALGRTAGVIEYTYKDW